jgi:hypothetical protein
MGVTGPTTGTCYLAAFDRTSQVAGVSTQTYEDYDNLRNVYVAGGGEAIPYIAPDIVAFSRNVMGRARAELGLKTGTQMEYRARRESELQNILTKLAMGGFRTAVCLDVGGLHAVGVEYLGDDYFATKSTWSPFDEEPVNVSAIFGLLDQSPRQHKRQYSGKKTQRLSNIFALPPESPRTKSPSPHA